MSFVNIYDMSENLISDTAASAAAAPGSGAAATGTTGTTAAAPGSGAAATGTTGTTGATAAADVAEAERIRLENEAAAAATGSTAATAAAATAADVADAAAAAEAERIRLENEADAAAEKVKSAADAAASTTAPGVSPPPKPERDANKKYAIIEINNGTISVTDKTDNLTIDKTPSQCLKEGANCKFALQISKTACNTSNDMCIDFENFKYMLHLNNIVPKETNFSGKLIDEEFLKPAASTASSDAKTVPNPASSAASTPASAASTPASATSAAASAASATSAAASATSATTSGAYTPDNVKQFLSIESNKNNFNNYLNSSDKKFGENINYLKIAESVVTNNIEIDNIDSKKCENLISEAAAYALGILDKYTSGIETNNTQYSEILTAFEILNAVDPQSTKANVNKDKINGEIKDKITKNIITDVIERSIDSKGPSYESIPKLTGYTPVIVDQGGSGNCFYYSVWGGLTELGDEKYKKITEELTNFAKTMKLDSDVVFDNDNDKEKFNINIRKLLALCFLADTNNTFYTSYNNMWNTGKDGVDTLIEAVKDLAYGLRTIIQAKCEQYKKDSNTKFFTPEEFKNILANNVSVNGVFATQIEVDMIKKVFSNCNVILDVYSPDKDTGEKLPTVFNDFSYIYVRHTGGEHYQQIQTTTGETKDCTFTRENLDGDSPFWKYNSGSAGGSRKNRQQKSKKTKRNYYTYKK